MVAGGSNNTINSTPISSTEALHIGSASWTLLTNLPIAVQGLQGVSWGNNTFVTGGKETMGTRSDILKYDHQENRWILMGLMKKAISAHAVTAIGLEGEVMDYCVVNQ